MEGFRKAKDYQLTLGGAVFCTLKRGGKSHDKFFDNARQ